MSKELICHANYSCNGKRYVYDVDRDEYEDRIEINLYKVDKSFRFAHDYSSPIRTLYHRIEYKNIGEEYKSQYLSWYNLFFCSNCYHPFPNNNYLETAVQKGIKTAATVLFFSSHSKKGQRYKRHMPDTCGWKSWGDGGFFVYRKGSLNTLFDIEKIRFIYVKHGLGNLDWDEISAISKIDLSGYADYRTVPFSLHCPIKKEYYVLNGLVLGYPVESTIALLNHTKYNYPASFRPIDMSYYTGSSDEFIQRELQRIKELDRADAAAAVYNVKQEGKSVEGVVFQVGERFRVLDADDDTGLIMKLGADDHQYNVSLRFLSSISEYKH